MATAEQMQQERVYRKAVKEMIDGLVKYGVNRPSMEEMVEAVKHIVRMRMLEEALEMFYQGKLRFLREDGVVYWEKRS